VDDPHSPSFPAPSSALKRAPDVSPPGKILTFYIVVLSHFEICKIDFCQRFHRIENYLFWVKCLVLVGDLAASGWVGSHINTVAVLTIKRSLWSQMITWLSFVINIVMLATWNARASLTDAALFINDSTIPEPLTE